MRVKVVFDNEHEDGAESLLDRVEFRTIADPPSAWSDAVYLLLKQGCYTPESIIAELLDSTYDFAEIWPRLKDREREYIRGIVNQPQAGALAEPVAHEESARCE